VEFQEGEVRLGDEEVLVVAVIADQREALGAAGQIVAEIARDAAEGDVDVLADEELRAVLRRVGRVAGVKVRGAVRPEAVDAIEIEARGPEIPIPSGSLFFSDSEVRSRVMSWSTNWPR
jgi:hypothetical protein